jgi:hypothetical protein
MTRVLNYSTPSQAFRYSRRAHIQLSRKLLFSAVCLLPFVLLAILSAGAVTISDRAGGAIYWGGKYVNIKPSAYSDYIGRRTAVDQMEVIMSNDVVTVKITGPYFFNYVHNVNRTRDALPGDLYISSQGWKVSGTPPYSKDIFEASEGWDYVVSFEKKAVYKLKFSDIMMTSALPRGSRYRAHQAWRGGYGEAIDDAEVILTDKGLSFTFSVRNMALRSEIGVHWTMKCGNDIIEGSASLPPIAMTAPPAPIELVNADPLGTEDIIPASMPIPAAASASEGPLTVGTAGGAGSYGSAPILAGAAFPVFHSGSDDTSFIFGPSSPPVIPVPSRPDVHIEPFSPPEPGTPVPEPSTAFLLLAGLPFTIGLKKHLRK